MPRKLDICWSAFYCSPTALSLLFAPEKITISPEQIVVAPGSKPLLFALLDLLQVMCSCHDHRGSAMSLK